MRGDRPRTEETYLIDTGESVQFYDEDHFPDKRDNYINRKILRVRITEEEQVSEQLKDIGLSADRNRRRDHDAAARRP